MRRLLFILAGTTLLSLSAMAQTGTPGISGLYEGEYRITMWGCPGTCSAQNAIVLGRGIKSVPWYWYFDLFEDGSGEGGGEFQGTTLTVGFDYEVQDIGNTSPDHNIVWFQDNGDGTYTVEHGFQIFNPNVGNPRTETTTTFRVERQGNELCITTLDRESDGSQDGVPGTQIVGVFPMTVQPQMNGWARLVGGDSSGDGIADSVKLDLGLNPNLRDTDGDGIDDVDELGADLANPLDSDGDGIIDALEPGDAAHNPQLAANLGLLGSVPGMGGSSATEESFCPWMDGTDDAGQDTGGGSGGGYTGEHVNLRVFENWRLADVSAGLMVREGNPAENPEALKSFLGAAGLEYPYGQIRFAALPYHPGQETPDRVTVQFEFSVKLPPADQMLLYSEERLAGGGSDFTLMPSHDWLRLDDSTLEVTFSVGSLRDLNPEDPDRISAAIAPTRNTLGNISRDEGGSFGWILPGLVLLWLMRLVTHHRFPREAP
ncbi:hypothetical protein LGV61_03260 [Desulfurispirillum indicum]|uniref:hypothetical protein n=1 Tax=Desulfurispirillum indicum TaxID=936456 RepID=UPI001CFB0552|nr:hypothetical protein [Desulfurispirillum indicum]UCZ57312.1 hypothetical protein LGV61_03260 [Desulfurispirillum indicum]